MSPPSSAAPQQRHARVAVSAVFFLNAVLFANLVPRLPEIKAELDLMRGGFLVSPTLVGLVADAVSLRAALSSVVVAGLVVLVLGRVLADISQREQQGAGLPDGRVTSS